MVSSQHPEAARAGVEILEMGGNAFDAAVAAGLALCVCEPAANGLGGQSMLLAHSAEQGRTTALDGSSRAPNRAVPDAIPPERRKTGHAATTVPSTPAVFCDVGRRFGRLGRHDVMAPAIRLAESGYRISPFQAGMLAKKADLLRDGPGGRFYLNDGELYQPGEVFRQPMLAKTLRRIETTGWTDFYAGSIARDICQDMRENGGLIDEDDLAQIPWPVERRPDWGHFARHKVATFPPAGAGRVLLQALQVHDGLHGDQRRLDSPEGAVVLARNLQQALVDHLGEPRDPALHAQLPQRMHGRDRHERLARRISHRLPPVSGETSHTSVMDDEGNVVGLTQSIEEFYGSCAASPRLGFLYNNYIGAFDTEDPTHPYHLRPNAVPWSSVAPTILFKRKKPRMVIGSPGSERIASVVGQVLMRWRDGEDLASAIAAPRLHAAHDGYLHLEAGRMGTPVLDALRRDGWEMVERNPFALYMGAVQAVWKHGRHYQGAADPRRDGCARGVET